jgi:hypothetical protein
VSEAGGFHSRMDYVRGLCDRFYVSETHVTDYFATVERAQLGSGGTAPPFLTSALDGGWVRLRAGLEAVKRNIFCRRHGLVALCYTDSYTGVQARREPTQAAPLPLALQPRTRSVGLTAVTMMPSRLVDM